MYKVWTIYVDYLYTLKMWQYESKFEKCGCVAVAACTIR